MTGFRPFKKVLDFYSSEITYKDLEKLIKRDVPEVYSFYVRRMKKPEKGRTSIGDFLRFAKNLFVEFLLQLTPVRRLIYSSALIFFVFAYINADWNLAIFSFLLLNLLIAFELADKLTAKGELEMAREIQSGLMPKSPPAHSHFQISFFAETALEVGGDYYDFFQDNNSENIKLIIGDMSGKGMAAALRMVQVQTILRNLICEHNEPKNILSELNRNLQNVLKKGSFFTAVLASIEADGRVNICRAGHMPVIHFSKSRNECVNITPKGIGIGLTGNSFFQNTLQETSLIPEHGDILVFYTDGIVECANRNLDQFGEERLKKLIINNNERSAEEIKESILNSLNKFTDGSPFSDDLTMIVMKTR